MLGGELCIVIRCHKLHELSSREVSNKRCGDELRKLSNGILSRVYRCRNACELHGMLSRELLRHHGSLGRHWCLQFWTVLCSIGIVMHQLPDGPVSSFYGIDELQQLSYGKLFR